MDVHYKTYASRSNRDIRFDQLLRTKPLSTCTASSTAFSKSSVTVSSRKKVNVVSFVPTGEGQELITRSPEKIVSDNVDGSVCSGTIQTSVSSQSYTLHSTSDLTPTSSPILSYSFAYKEYSDYSAITSVADTSRNPSSNHKFNRSPIRYTNSVYEQHPCTLSSQATTLHCITSNSQSGVTSYRSLSGATATKVTGQPVIQRVDKSQINPVVTISNSQLKTYSCNNTAKSIHDRILPNPCSVSTSDSMDPLAINVAKPTGRPILTGKNKRAAYNPRSWQKDIETEDTSPTKLQKLIEPFPGSQSTTTITTTTATTAVNSTHSSTNNNNNRASSFLTAQKPNNRQTCLTDNNKKSSTNKSDNYAFHDFDEEEEEDEDVDKFKKAFNPSRPLSQSYLPSVMKSSHHSLKSSSNHHHQSSDEQDGDDGDEDIEDDDVKPWFRPASREKTSIKSMDKLSINSTKNMKVNRSEKPLYTVLRKVKEAHVCQEQGEAQHLLDDVEYLVDGLADRNQVNTRALSVLTLANKCLAASFRYTLNAHGLLKRICAKLHDAHKDYALALTSAGLMFVLSRDRDPNILDVESLAIVLKLFSAPDANTNGTTGHTEASKSKEAERVRARVRQLLDGLHQNSNSNSNNNHHNNNSKNLSSITSNTLTDTGNNSNSSGGGGGISSNLALFSGGGGGAGKRPLLPLGSKPSMNLNLNTRHLQMTRQLTTSDLVIESILNFGTRKAGDWFKAELRNGGGLDRVADAASDAVDYLADLDPANKSQRVKPMWRSTTGIDNFALDRLKRVCHYTRLLENMTYMNSDNQTYLVHYRDGILVNRLLICLRVCVCHLPITTPPSSSTVAPSANQQTPNTTTTTGEKSTVNSIKSLSNTSQTPQYDNQTILTDCILGIFRFLVNVSHNEFASERLGACTGFLETIFDCLLKLPDRLPATKRFDVLVLLLCLLVNMCEHCPENRTRIVYLDITKSCVKKSNSSPAPPPSSSSSVSSNQKTVGKYIDTYDDEEEDEEEPEDGEQRQVVTSTALDELIQLFLTREECARNHDFERDDDEAVAAEARRRTAEESKITDGDVVDNKQLALRPGHPNPTVEEAGLKWRLIEDRRALGLNNRGFLGKSRRRMFHKKKSRSLKNKKRHSASDIDDDDEEDEDFDEIDDNSEEEEEDDDELDDDSDEDDDDDDESVGSGADVEFVADTQEEQEKLAKSMSQAQQHMEDSVVAAYAALLLGCILQSSPRYTDRIRSKLPNGQFRPLAIMLAKLLSFLSLTKGVGSSGSESILRIVRILEAQDNNNAAANNKSDLVKVSTSNGVV
ncbi:unnamed protein product [Trichobilharzia szidati]|nr:unnamed protein product [Trichobilharzia szidati]